MNPAQTWHQLTLEMSGDKNAKQYVVFERRESDTDQDGWRLAHFEPV